MELPPVDDPDEQVVEHSGTVELSNGSTTLRSLGRLAQQPPVRIAVRVGDYLALARSYFAQYGLRILPPTIDGNGHL